MTREHSTDELNNNNNEKELHYEALARKLANFFLRNTQDPASALQRTQLMLLLTSPNQYLEDKNLSGLAHLLLNEKMGEITRNCLRDLLSESPLLLTPNDVLQISLGQYLGEEDKAAFGVANNFLYGIFKGPVENELKKLLQFVANGDQDSAEKLVARNADLLLQKRDITDPAGRSFKNISPLQYAQWSGDWYMKKMLLDHLPKQYQKEVRKQLNEVKRLNAENKEDVENQKGIEYQLYLDLEDPKGEITAEVLENAEKEGPGKSGAFLEGRTPVILCQPNVQYRVSLPPENYDYIDPPLPGKTRVLVTVTGERNYDYQPLIAGLRTYEPIYARWEASGFKDPTLAVETVQHWCRVVGLVQKYATAFLAQQYCHPDRSFEGVKFDEPTLKRALNFYDCVNSRFTHWFLRASGLGSDFGIISPDDGGVGADGRWRLAGGSGGAGQTRAIETLCKTSPEKLASAEREYFAELAPSKSHRLT